MMLDDLPPRVLAVRMDGSILFKDSRGEPCLTAGSDLVEIMHFYLGDDEAGRPLLVLTDTDPRCA